MEHGIFAAGARAAGSLPFYRAPAPGRSRALRLAGLSSILLTEPRLNYVSQPLKIVCISDHKARCFPDLSAVSPSGFDLLVDGPVGDYRDALRRYAIDLQLHVVQQFGSGDTTAELLEK